MQKIDSLRAALEAALPEMKADPTRLRIWVDRGTGRAVQSESQNFGFSFRVNLLVTEMASDIAVLGLALFRWLRRNQPDLLLPGTDGFTFDVDILSNRTVDVLVQVMLTQNVIAEPQQDGSYQLSYMLEPDPLFLDGLGLGDVDPIPLLKSVSVVGEGMVAPLDLPD